MKVKVIKEAYYNDSLVKVGEIIDYKKKPLPSWATLVDGVETKKGKEKKQEVKEPEYDGNKTGNGEGENTPDKDGDNSERVEYLNLLIDESIEKGIVIEDADKKDIEEQIKELEEALGK